MLGTNARSPQYAHWEYEIMNGQDRQNGPGKLITFVLEYDPNATPDPQLPAEAAGGGTVIGAPENPRSQCWRAGVWFGNRVETWSPGSARATNGLGPSEVRLFGRGSETFCFTPSRVTIIRRNPNTFAAQVTPIHPGVLVRPITWHGQIIRNSDGTIPAQTPGAPSWHDFASGVSTLGPAQVNVQSSGDISVTFPNTPTGPSLGVVRLKASTWTGLGERISAIENVSANYLDEWLAPYAGSKVPDLSKVAAVLKALQLRNIVPPTSGPTPTWLQRVQNSLGTLPRTDSDLRDMYQTLDPDNQRRLDMYRNLISGRAVSQADLARIWSIVVLAATIP
jgi:hypothetical protein